MSEDPDRQHRHQHHNNPAASAGCCRLTIITTTATTTTTPRPPQKPLLSAAVLSLAHICFLPRAGLLPPRVGDQSMHQGVCFVKIVLAKYTLLGYIPRDGERAVSLSIRYCYCNCGCCDGIFCLVVPSLHPKPQIRKP